MAKKEQKLHSMEKYWLILFCWFFSPLFLKTVFKVRISENLLGFGFTIGYWLFVMITAAWEAHHQETWLKKHYYHIWKKEEMESEKIRRSHRIRAFWHIREYTFLFHSTTEDKELAAFYRERKSLYHFIFTSFFAEAAFGLFYLISGIVT